METLSIVRPVYCSEAALVKIFTRNGNIFIIIALRNVAFYFHVWYFSRSLFACFRTSSLVCFL